MQINESFVADTQQQYLLDAILKDQYRETCPDCGAKVGEVHDPCCDFCTCPLTGQQRMGCLCSHCIDLKWQGNSDMSLYAYKNRRLCLHFPLGDDRSAYRIAFDINWAIEQKMFSFIDRRQRGEIPNAKIVKD